MYKISLHLRTKWYTLGEHNTSHLDKPENRPSAPPPATPAAVNGFTTLTTADSRGWLRRCILMVAHSSSGVADLRLLALTHTWWCCYNNSSSSSGGWRSRYLFVIFGLKGSRRKPAVFCHCLVFSAWPRETSTINNHHY